MPTTEAGQVSGFMAGGAVYGEGVVYTDTRIVLETLEMLPERLQKCQVKFVLFKGFPFVPSQFFPLTSGFFSLLQVRPNCSHKGHNELRWLKYTVLQGVEN